MHNLNYQNESKILELVNVEGNAVYVRPEQIAAVSVERYKVETGQKQEGCRIHLNNGANFMTPFKAADIAEILGTVGKVEL